MQKIKYLVTIVCLSFAFIFNAAAQLPDFTSLVEENSGAVVNISTVQSNKNNVVKIPEIEGLPPFFKDFLENFPEFKIPYNPNQQPRESFSLGSGFIISTDGYILTNHHVIVDADKILVRLSDKSEYEAKLIGSDSRTDVALLKIDAADLPTIKVGNIDNLKVGSWVLAIGSPFGFDYSVTAGIVSAKGRSLPDENYVPFIQTDVSINPGNSGGPLFNLQGEVVGINSQIFTKSGGFMGLSFAIPINIAMDIADQLRTSGKITRGYIGVYIQEVTKEIADSFGLNKATGALITEVQNNSPSSRAGLSVGDVILSIDNKTVDSSSDLPKIVTQYKPGDKAKFDIIRNGEKMKIEVEIGSSPENNVQSSSSLGIAVEEVSDDQKTKLKISGGVIVSEIRSKSSNNLGGLQQGDIITHIDNKPVSSSSDFISITNNLPKNKSISVRIIRGENAHFITFKLN